MTEAVPFAADSSSGQKWASSQNPAESASELTAGEMLRSARMAQGVDINHLSSILKVPAVKIEAMENNQHEAFPDAVFIRALASSMCRLLGADSSPVLARLPQGIVPHLRANPQTGQTRFQPDGNAHRPFAKLALSRFSLFAAVAFVIAAGAVFVMPDVHVSSQAVNESIGQVKGYWQKLSGSVFSLAGSSQTQVVPDLPADTQSQSPHSPGSAAEPSMPASSQLPVATATNAPPTPVSSGLIVFRARSASWVEVVDNKKGVVLRRLVEAGESVSVSSDLLPLSVVVGRADAMEVSVRGENFEFATFSKNNVARFEVN